MSFKYLVYDIESVTDKPLLNRVLYSRENFSHDQAYAAHMAELAKEDKNFVNISFHQPVAMAAIAVGNDYSISKIGLIGGDDRTTANIVRGFWEMYNNQRPLMVDFNGHGYDMRLLELWAFRLGVTIGPYHFKKFGPRYRYSFDNHLDLHDFLTNNGAVRYQGGLNLFAKLLGKPGKMTTHGDMVQMLFDEGKLFQIEDYCLCDALDTYFIFLRTRVITGELSLVREKELVVAARQAILQKSQEEGYLKAYLEHFGEWLPG